MSNVSKRRREGTRTKIKSVGDHKEFLKRITKTLYYGQLPTLPCLSLPVTEISCSLWSLPQRGRSLRRLHADAAAGIARSACVSPCALVLAILYLERLNTCNPDYLAATAPADLFLVSLMVGNKFLQDDGEDDEVICSEWAASGGIELDQLKKLEVEFLDAIEWNVYVSDKKFEGGLAWLEAQVALRQAQARGFFTYTDLAAAEAGAGAGAGGGAALGALAAACAALTLAYLSALLTLVTSALLISHVCLPALQPAPAPAPAALDTAVMTPEDSLPNVARFIENATLTPSVADPETYLSADSISSGRLRCCTDWVEYRDATISKKTWFDGVVAYDWKSFETWWSRTSLSNWLYQSSLVSPMQRWLEKMDEYADYVKRDVVSLPGTEHADRCRDFVKPSVEARCVRQWLNLSKLSALIASVSDR